MAFFTTATFSTTCLSPHNSHHSHPSASPEHSNCQWATAQRGQEDACDKSNKAKALDNLNLCLSNKLDTPSPLGLICQHWSQQAVLTFQPSVSCTSRATKISPWDSKGLVRGEDHREKRKLGPNIVGHQKCTMDEASCTPKFSRKVMPMLSSLFSL